MPNSTYFLSLRGEAKLRKDVPPAGRPQRDPPGALAVGPSHQRWGRGVARTDSGLVETVHALFGSSTHILRTCCWSYIPYQGQALVFRYGRKSKFRRGHYKFKYSPGGTPLHEESFHTWCLKLKKPTQYIIPYGLQPTAARMTSTHHGLT